MFRMAPMRESGFLFRTTNRMASALPHQPTGLRVHSIWIFEKNDVFGCAAIPDKDAQSPVGVPDDVVGEMDISEISVTLCSQFQCTGGRGQDTVGDGYISQFR